MHCQQQIKLEAAGCNVYKLSLLSYCSTKPGKRNYFILIHP